MLSESYFRMRSSVMPVILATVFLDLVGISLVIPVAAPLFLGDNGSLFAHSASLEYRTLVLGLLLGTAPLIQFFSAPLLGAYSDRAGRKPVLILSLLASGLGHLLFGVGILTGQLWLLFFSRLLAGAGAGNLSTANSAAADISGPKDKVKNFGLVGMAIGLGLIFGPYLGGKLSDPTAVSWFNYATPLWVAGILAFLDSLVVAFLFRETLKERLHRKMDIWTGARNVFSAFTMPKMRGLYGVNFLLTFGFNFFVQFFSVFLVARLHFTSSQIGALVAYIGICLAISQGFLTRQLAKFVGPVTVLRWGPLLTAISLFSLARVEHPYTVYWLLPLVAVFYSINLPNITAMISDLADRESQGEALGISQSMSALSFAIPPIISGIVAAIDVSFPLMLAAIFMALAWLAFLFVSRYHERRTFHEV